MNLKRELSEVEKFLKYIELYRKDKGKYPDGMTKDLALAIDRMKDEIINKDTPVKVIRKSTHLWKLDKNGEIDTNYWYQDYHNGPVCTICGEYICIHCNPDWEEQKCDVGYCQLPTVKTMGL